MKVIALLRGINIGGHNKIPMSDLVAVCLRLNLRNVETYLQSGNVVFEAGGTQTGLVGMKLEQAIRKEFGFDVEVILRTQADF